MGKPLWRLPLIFIDKNSADAKRHQPICFIYLIMDSSVVFAASSASAILEAS